MKNIDLLKQTRQKCLEIQWKLCIVEERVNGFRKIPQDNPNIKENDIILEKDFQGLNNCRLCDKLTYEIGDRKFIKYIWIREN